MSIKTFCQIVIASLTLAVVSPLEAQVLVTKTAGQDFKNPTLFIKGITGDQEAASIVVNNLRRCGWFDVVAAADNADYRISGNATAAALYLEVSGAHSFSVTQPLGGNRNHQLRRGVDMVLKKLFGIPGICASRIAFCVTAGKAKNIFICDFDGQNIRQLTRHTNLCVEPEWTPDALSVVYTMYGNSNTDIIQTVIEPLRSRMLVRMPGTNSGAAISPDGRMLALVGSFENQVELYVKSVSGTAMRRLTRDRAVESSPTWSADSTRICFVSDRGGRPDLYIIGVNGGTAQKLPTLGTEAVSPHMARNGSIVYSCRMGGNYALAIISADEKVASGIIVSGGGDWESPSWAPDDRHVICVKNDGKSSSLYIVDTWTKTSRPFLSGHEMTFPSWSNVF